MNSTPEQLSNRQILISTLRAELPTDFIWDFSVTRASSGLHCGTAGCAMYLAEKLNLVKDCFCDTQIQRAFGLDNKTVNIFLNTDYYDADYMDQVTPKMVADALEALQ